MRVVDILLSFPMILLAICLIAFFGSSLANVMIAVGISLSPRFARIARGLTPFGQGVRLYRGSPRHGRRPAPDLLQACPPQHLRPPSRHGHALRLDGHPDRIEPELPGSRSPAAGPDLGVDHQRGREDPRLAPWISTFAGVVIMITVLAFNLLGDALRDFLDPRLRRQI